MYIKYMWQTWASYRITLFCEQPWMSSTAINWNAEFQTTKNRVWSSSVLIWLQLLLTSLAKGFWRVGALCHWIFLWYDYKAYLLSELYHPHPHGCLQTWLLKSYSLKVLEERPKVSKYVIHEGANQGNVRYIQIFRWLHRFFSGLGRHEALCASSLDPKFISTEDLRGRIKLAYLISINHGNSSHSWSLEKSLNLSDLICQAEKKSCCLWKLETWTIYVKGVSVFKWTLALSS